MKRLTTLISFLLCIVSNASSQIQMAELIDSTLYVPNKNKVQFSEPIELKIGGKKIKSIPSVVKINGIPVYSEVGGVEKRPIYTGKEDFFISIFKKIKYLFELLPDGNYEIRPINFVVGANGKLLYFDFLKIRDFGDGKLNTQISSIPTFDTSNKSLSQMLQLFVDNNVKNNISATHKQSIKDTSISFRIIEKRIYNELYKALSAANVKFSPAEKSGKSVNCMLYISPKLITVQKQNAGIANIFKGPFKR